MLGLDTIIQSSLQNVAGALTRYLGQPKSCPKWGTQQLDSPKSAPKMGHVPTTAQKDAPEK